MSKRIYPNEKARRQAEYQRRRKKIMESRPPDPILGLSEIDRAYLAGLIDGEGCLRVTRVGGMSRYFYPEAGIGMTHRGVIEWVQEKLSSGTIKLNNHTKIREGWKPQFYIKLHGVRAKLLCQVLLPFLRVKRRQAEIIVAFPTGGQCGPGRPLPDEIVKARQIAFEEMKVLNRRGK